MPHDATGPGYNGYQEQMHSASHCLNDVVQALLEVHKSSLVWQVWENLGNIKLNSLAF